MWFRLFSSLQLCRLCSNHQSVYCEAKFHDHATIGCRKLQKTEDTTCMCPSLQAKSPIEIEVCICQRCDLWMITLNVSLPPITNNCLFQKYFLNVFSSFFGGLQYWYDKSQTWSLSSKWKNTYQIVRGNNDDHIEAWVWITFHQRCGSFVSNSMKSNLVFENPFKWIKYIESMIFFSPKCNNFEIWTLCRHCIDLFQEIWPLSLFPHCLWFLNIV